MGVVAAILIALSMIFIMIMSWCVCAMSPRDNMDDEKQLHYIDEWRRKHGL